MDFSKGIRRFLSYFIPLSLAGALNLVSYRTVWLRGFLHAGVASSILIEVVYLQWYLSVRRRFPQKQMRHHTAVFALLFMLLSMLRVAKYCFVAQGSTAARYLWYAYYIPLIFGPLFMVFASLYFGKPDDFKASANWRLLFLPASLLLAGLFTNDFHQWAFRFPQGLENWETYRHNWLYYAVTLWVVLMILGVIFFAARSMFSRRLLKRVWIPATVFGIVLLYYVLYSSGEGHSMIQSIFGMNDFICIASISMWESLVSARIIVSNTDHPSIFAVSSLNAGLADRTFQVRQRSQSAVSPPPEMLREAKSRDVPTDGGNTLLKSRAVQGGWFFWTEDISELRRLNEELQETAGELAEENAMMRAATEMDEERRSILAQTQLSDRVTASLRPQLDKLNSWSSDLPAEEGAYCDALRQCNVLLAYCKRRSNLLLQANAQPVLNGEELRSCFEESAMALRLSKIQCEISVDPLMNLSAEDAALLYEAFETVLETALPALFRMTLTLSGGKDGSPVLQMTISLYENQKTHSLPEQIRKTAEDVNEKLKPIAACFDLALENEKEDEALCD